MLGFNLNSRVNRGFTLIELLIALFLAGIITSAAMSVYITQHKQLLVQDDISDMQAGIRAAAVELSTQIRMAGYNVPDGIPELEAYNTNPDTIVITYDSADIQGLQIEHDMPQPSSELRCDGHDLSGLNDNDWVFIYDPSTNDGEFFEISHVQYGASHIQHNTMPLQRRYPAGSLIIKLNRFKFYIDDSDTDHPNLMVWAPGMGAQVYAENITSLNVQYVLASGALVDVPPTPDMVREVIIDIDARTDKADDEFETPYRTRSLTTRVKVRNLGVG